MTSSQKLLCHFVTSEGITALVCFFSVCEVTSQLKMAVVEQCTNIKFCVWLQKSPAEIQNLLQQVYGERAMKKSRVCVGHKCCRDGCEGVDDLCSGHPSMSTNKANVKHVPKIVRSDRRKSVDQIASEDGISVGSCHTILHDVLNMCHICQRLVLRMLVHEHKES